MASPLTFLCVSNYVKGETFLRECADLGIKTVLITKEELRDKEWPDCIDEMFFISDLGRIEDLFLAVSYLARTREFHSIIPLDDYAVETAAALREHLRCPGMGETTARYFRDKLAMRIQARESDLKVPQFVHVLNHGKLDEFSQQVDPPWLIKPRSEAGSVQIQKLHNSGDLWQAVHALGDRQSFHLVERFIPGEVVHVDAIAWDYETVFAVAHRYWRPPFNVWNEGGVFITERIPPKDSLCKKLLKASDKAVKAMGLKRGVTHIEFILGEDGELYFLELAARVVGAHIDHLIEAETGVNLWKEWARLERAFLEDKKYKVKPSRDLHGGLLLCLSKQESPDLSFMSDSAVAWTLAEEHHAGVAVADKKAEKVRTLMETYHQQILEDILAVAPPTSKPA